MIISSPPQNEFIDPRSVIKKDQDEPFWVTAGRIRPTTGWSTFFSNAYQILFGVTQSGTSAQKPTTGLYIGRTYYDTSLGAQLRLASISPVVWTATFSRHKSTDQSVSNSTTLANDADLFFPVLANDEYIGRIHLDVGASLKDTGIKVAVSAPSGASGHIYAEIITDAISAGEVALKRTDTIGSALDFTTGDLGNCLNGGVSIMFHITNGSTAGNIRVQFAQSTSSGTALTLRTGSQMKVDKTA